MVLRILLNDLVDITFRNGEENKKEEKLLDYTHNNWLRKKQENEN